MKRSLLAWSSILAFAWVSGASADVLICPYAYNVFSPNGKYSFRMMPNPRGRCDRTGGYGYLTERIPDRPNRLVWRTSGWYAFDTYISCDGSYLVRLNEVLSDPIFTDLNDKALLEEAFMAIGFYRDGVKVKGYDVYSLGIKTGMSVQTIVWRDRGTSAGFDPPCGLKFQLVAADGTRLRFDVASGEIIAREPMKTQSNPSDHGRPP